MRSFSQLEELWSQHAASPRDRGEVELIVSRPAPGVHEVLNRANLTVEGGLEGDRWARAQRPNRARQITLMNVDVARWLAGDDIPLHTPGDNFLVDFDLTVDSMPVGKRVRMGEALLEVSELPHTGCEKFKQRFGAEAHRWISEAAHSARRLRGLNCTIIEPGVVAVGDFIVSI